MTHTDGSALAADVRAHWRIPELGPVEVTCTSGQVSAAVVEKFVVALSGALRDGGSLDAVSGVDELPSIRNSPVSWRRQRLVCTPLYVESLVVADDLPAEGTVVPGRAALTRPGRLVVTAAWVKEAASGGLTADALREVLDGLGAGAPGGLCVNAIQIPAAALASGEIDLRPLTLRALDAAGHGVDRGQPESQRGIANAFWQTYWATGALREQRGAVFPVVFLPVDRRHPREFAAPFLERYVSLRRRLFGRTAIVTYVLEELCKARALYLDLHARACCVRADCDLKSRGLLAGDTLLAVDELNRTGFADVYTGANRERVEGVSGWEASGDLASTSTEWPDTKTAVDLARIQCQPDTDTGRYLRVHRVVPFSGCATLGEVALATDQLQASGKIAGFDGQILAATNSNFFLNFPEEYATLHSAMNDPVTVLVEAGETIQLRTMRRAAFVLTEDGRAAISTRCGNHLKSEALLFEGESASVTAFERAGGPYRDNRFGPLFFGAVVAGNSVVETFEEMATDIPSNGWVTGDSEAFGGELEPQDAVEVQLPRDGGGFEAIRHALAVGPLLLKGGEIVPLGTSGEEFCSLQLREPLTFEETAELARTELPAKLLNCAAKGVPPTRFPYDWNETRAPRTALGILPDRSVLLVVVDGRLHLPHSVGVTLCELASLMKQLGCVDAMNLDGGGSSVMYVKDERAAGLKLRDELREGVVSLPSDGIGVERLLPVPLVVCRRT